MEAIFVNMSGIYIFLVECDQYNTLEIRYLQRFQCIKHHIHTHQKKAGFDQIIYLLDFEEQSECHAKY